MSTLHTLQQTLAHQQVDLCFIQNPSTIGYLTGFHSEPHERVFMLILVPNDKPLLVLPALDYELAKESTTGLQFLPHFDSENVWEKLAQTLRPYISQAKKVSIEKNFVTMQTLEHLTRILPTIQFTHDVSSTIEQLKLIKTPEEITLLKEAGKTADLATKIAAQTLQEGITESAVIAEIEYQLKKQNVSKMSFDTMVLSQANAANPHGNPGLNKIHFNEFVLVDLGTMHQGYASDMTRTLFFGDNLSSEQEKIYNIVLEAHHTARDMAKIGMTASELDAIARNIITKYGYGDYFTHRLGHGIGQTVHEFPSIASGNDFVLQENMCFSIEPGIYIPGKIGVRIEDCFYLTPTGAQSFTFSPYSLNWKDYI
ncbi:aminopeptidase P family protein [Carnobacteriaceae bacterium zg-84]|uniref:M24 family metallopeptidase n=1 Tax=Granulicatella sp. zg-84 TaxID=2678503 RepID=UPI0013C0957D|nr:Xaa-Pro peptidase family protein [Granulicatella sp. zg-84]NEW65416.1 M24 family metallopeptidase [Granulicatella sp. zg-84]QMI85214.1 aminopeptidase P family protein [Carnobacteriaceae bacterium zg-84]